MKYTAQVLRAEAIKWPASAFGGFTIIILHTTEIEIVVRLMSFVDVEVEKVFYFL